MITNLSAPPPPIYTGSHLTCPYLDTVPEGYDGPELSFPDLRCRWKRRIRPGSGTKRLKAYRRHWRREHLALFQSDPAEHLAWLAKIPYEPYRGLRVHALVSHDGHDPEQPDWWPYDGQRYTNTLSARLAVAPWATPGHDIYHDLLEAKRAIEARGTRRWGVETVRPAGGVL